MSTIQANSIAPACGQESAPQKGSRAVAQSVLSKALILGLQAGTGILTARELRPWGRGELAAMILWPLLAANVTTLGIPSSLIYFLRHRPEDRNRLVANGFLMAAALGLVAGLATTGILPLCLRQYSPSILDAAEWFLITVPICSVTLAGRAVLEAAHDFSGSNAIQTLTPLATLIVLLAFFGARCLNPYTAGIAYIVASIPAFLLMVGRVLRARIKSARPEAAVMKQILGYGIRSYGIDVLGTLALYVDQVLVIGLLSPGAMGSYVVVLSLSRMLNLFQNSVVMVLFPKAAGRPAREVIDMTGDSVRVSSLVAAVCGIVVWLAGPALLRIVYGSDYVAAAGALRILVVEVVLSGATFVLAQAFMALNRPGIVTALQGFGLSLSIPLMILLIPRFGIYGAAISLLVSTTARLVFVYASFHLFLKTRPPRLIPAAGDLRMLLSCLMDWRLERGM
jgi:O-antigen/teichoic acid export membrane protein